MRVGELTFVLDATIAARTAPDVANRFVLMKTPELVDDLTARLRAIEPQVIVEFGIQRGGSIALFNELFTPRLHLGFDINREPVASLAAYAKSAKASGRSIELHYGVNQSDREAVTRIMADAMRRHGINGVDVVIDDASHLYGPSLATFEVMFPLLRSDGLYVLEDWGWAHWPGYQKEGSSYWNEPALSNLVFELTMLCASRPDLAKAMDITSALACLKRGAAAPPPNFTVESQIRKRGVKIVMI
jgi:hypothetical protein